MAVQVLDYGVALKLNDGALATTQLIRLLQLMLILEPKGSINYPCAVAIQVMLLIYQKKRGLPAWDFVKHNLAAFNEETGEMMFSVLSRVVLGDTVKSKFEHMDQMYTLLHAYRLVDDDVRDDMEREGPRANWRIHSDPLSPEVEATRSWLQMQIRAARHNQVTIYAGPEAYKSKTKAANKLEKLKEVVPMWGPTTVASNLDMILKNIEARFTNKSWAMIMKDVWPEFARRPKRPLEILQRRAPAPKKAPQDDEDESNDDDTDTSSSGSGSSDEDGPIDDRADHDAESHDGCASSDSDADKPGTMDVNQQGRPVEWKKWGNVDPGNITQSPRQARRVKSKKKADPNFPFHSFSDDDHE